MCIHAAAYILLSEVLSFQIGFGNTFQKIWAKHKFGKWKRISSLPPCLGLGPTSPRGLPISLPPLSFSPRPSQRPHGPPSGPEGQPAPRASPSLPQQLTTGSRALCHYQVGPDGQNRLLPWVRAGYEPSSSTACDSARFPCFIYRPEAPLAPIQPEPQPTRPSSPKSPPRSAASPIHRCSAFEPPRATCRALFS